MVLRFDVVGVPAPQGSKSAVVRGGKARVIEGRSAAQRAKHQAWREAVAWSAKQAHEESGVPRATGPTLLILELRFPRPGSRPKAHHGWHVVRPDKDKVLRACLDGLTDSGLISDDSIICDFQVTAVETTEWTGASFLLKPLAVPAYLLPPLSAPV